MVCLLCHSDMDSHNHLFFKCPFTNQLWNMVLHKLKMHNHSSDWEGVFGSFANMYNGNSIGSIVRRLCLAASVYTVWQERNNRFFRDERRNVEDLFKMVCDSVKSRLISLRVTRTTTGINTEIEWEIKFVRDSE